MPDGTGKAMAPPPVQNSNTNPNVMPTAVMGTNDNCTVSKRSVEILYYPKPHFYRYFVKKPKKRTALINRGYLLRMKAIEYELKQFLSQTVGRKVVVNLGCGYDALPFRALSGFAELCNDTVYVDVDYETLILEKVQIIQKNEELSGLLKGANTSQQKLPITLWSENYLAVACDLADSHALQDLLAKEFSPDTAFFFISEVSITYMPVETADALLGWMSRLSSARFCLLEQCLPNGPFHPFASTMLKHFNKLASPLRVVQRYQTIEDQQDRFHNFGWSNIDAKSLWSIWCQGQVFSAEERSNLRSVEIFDEHEEFALFANHYFVLTATGLGQQGGKASNALRGSISFPKTELPPLTSTTRPRRAGVLYEAQNNTFVHHGGDDGRSRLVTSQVYISNEEKDVGKDVIMPELSARKQHTVTKLNANNDYLLVGGRDSPGEPLRDCWLRKDMAWSRVEDLPKPLFRHSATFIESKQEQHQTISGVVVFGGKTSHDCDSNTWYLWQDGQGWRELGLDSKRITPRFSSNFIYLNEEHVGILLGGMVSSEIVSNEAFAWTLVGNKINIDPLQVTGCNSNELQINRAGADFVQYRDRLLLVGGIARSGLPRSLESSSGDILNLKFHSGSSTGERHSLQCCPDQVSFRMPPELPQPLLIGHSTIVKDNVISIVGGGAICFSFGSFMNKTTWHLLPRDNDQSQWRIGAWKLKDPITIQNSATGSKGYEDDDPRLAEDVPTLQKHVASEGCIPVKRITPESKDTLPTRIGKMKPCIFESVNLGSCVKNWTPEYLKAALNSDRLLDIHYTKADTMLFESKNFQIQKQTFSDFIDAIENAEKRYLRAVSMKDKHKPTNFYQDFDALAPDFQLPSHLSITENMLHSSVFRISGPINMWLHYDTLSNILCQIRGSKKLLLFSPADVGHLKIPPGRSSSDLDVFDPTAWKMTSLKYTHPYEAVLRPGDVLYIPPLWCHAALPLDGFSVAINTFFKTEDDQQYAIGKDTYGNKDIAEYEYARNDISKAIGRFSSAPRDTRRFYLERLADELLREARKKK